MSDTNFNRDTDREDRLYKAASIISFLRDTLVVSCKSDEQLLSEKSSVGLYWILREVEEIIDESLVNP